MKKSLIVLSIAALAFTGCKQFKKGEGDMMYKIHTDKTTPKINEGDFVSVWAIQKTEDDSVIYSSYDYDRPSFLALQKPAFQGDLYTAIGMLSEGDSATFKISLDSLTQKAGAPKPANIKGKYMVYTLKVEKVIPKGKNTDQVFQAKIEEFFKAETDKAKKSESARIAAFIKKEDLKPTVTASGLNYVITKESKGPLAKPGDTVEVNYSGKFLGGKVFDTSDEAVAKKANIHMQGRPYQPIKIPVGVGSGIITGWEEALLLLPQGTKATLILPSKLAYGEQGSQPAIPPFTPLVFDVEIVKVIPSKGGAAPASK